MQNIFNQIKIYIKSLTKKQKITTLIVLIFSAAMAVIMAILTVFLILR